VRIEEGLIGRWVVREGTAKPQRAHLVQSVIADRVVTRCGREMPGTSDWGDLAESTAADNCKRCAA
jgi:hypothetical protein